MGCSMETSTPGLPRHAVGPCVTLVLAGRRPPRAARRRVLAELSVHHHLQMALGCHSCATTRLFTRTRGSLLLNEDLQGMWETSDQQPARRLGPEEPYPLSACFTTDPDLHRQ